MGLNSRLPDRPAVSMRQGRERYRNDTATKSEELAEKLQKTMSLWRKKKPTLKAGLLQLDRGGYLSE